MKSCGREHLHGVGPAAAWWRLLWLLPSSHSVPGMASLLCSPKDRAGSRLGPSGTALIPGRGSMMPRSRWKGACSPGPHSTPSFLRCRHCQAAISKPDRHRLTPPRRPPASGSPCVGMQTQCLRRGRAALHRRDRNARSPWKCSDFALISSLRTFARTMIRRTVAWHASFKATSPTGAHPTRIILNPRSGATHAYAQL